MKSFAPVVLFFGFALIGAACQSVPEPVPEPQAEEPALPDNIDVPEPPDPETPVLNEWGGEVPLSVPTGAVTEEGLEDLR